MIHKDISNQQWNAIVSHFPKAAKTGRPRNNDRMIINGILFVLTKGCRWAEIPKRYGSKSTAHLRFQELQQRGVLKKILTKLILSARRQEKVTLKKILSDSTITAKKRR